MENKAHPDFPCPSCRISHFFKEPSKEKVVFLCSFILGYYSQGLLMNYAHIYIHTYAAIAIFISIYIESHTSSFYPAQDTGLILIFFLYISSDSEKLGFHYS